jgi:transcriptional regulator with XRE-family HTH domain
MSLRTLSDRTRLTETTLRNYEKGRTSPNIDLLDTIAQSLQLPVKDLLPR